MANTVSKEELVAKAKEFGIEDAEEMTIKELSEAILDASEAADKAMKKNPPQAPATADSDKPVYLFPADDGKVLYNVTYIGGVMEASAEDKTKKVEKSTIFVRICGQGITLKKGATVVMSRSCEIPLGKHKHIKMVRKVQG